MSDLSDHPFSSENIAYELGGDSAEDRRWYAFVAAVERLLGACLDGDQETDGYSLDFAFEAWGKGETAISYVDGINKRRQLARGIAEAKAAFPEWKHARDCAYVTSDGPAPCTCDAGRRAAGYKGATP